MLVKCCVSECDSPPNVSYYSWPKEKECSAEWCTLVFKSVAIPANNMNKKLLVCAQHFSRDDYVNGLQAELLAPLGFTKKIQYIGGRIALKHGNKYIELRGKADSSK